MKREGGGIASCLLDVRWLASRRTVRYTIHIFCTEDPCSSIPGTLALYLDCVEYGMHYSVRQVAQSAA
jgi:hypothetical protein